MKSVFAWVMSLMVGLSVLPAQAVVAASQEEKGKILVVMTNHERYPSRSDTTGLWLTELTHFMDTVEAAGYTTVFISPKGGKVPLDERSLKWLYMDEPARQHLKSARFLARLDMTAPAASIDPSGFSAIYFTGGHGVMWDFPENKELQRLAESIYAKGGVVAAVCHGVAGLINLKDENGQALVKGKHITGFSNREEWLSGMRSQVPFFLEDQLVGKGALYQEALFPFTSYVITDGRIVTGQNPQSPKEVAEAVLVALTK